MGDGGQAVQIILDTWSQVWGNLALYLSKIIVALIVFIAGIVIAKIIEKLIVQVLKVARFDVLSEKAGIASILAKGEIKHTLSELIGIVFYWLMALVVVIITLNLVSPSPEVMAGSFLDEAVKYAGKVILSIFVLVLGLFFAALIGSVVRTTASNAGIATAKNLGQIAQTVIIVITVLTVLPMLGVRTFILDMAVVVTLAATGLALGLAFGLGSKELAGKMMSEIVDKWKRK
ncbi:MAG TPA: hypothetical protein P5521_05410 [Candidatus Omnitrophota bacterium]|nr:hypothetical protein [Candidatus Omnitrophota bacterium]HPM43466.1 hypothetical protein [Candidatus Omnitrophota bacterium]HRZ67551.1 hypothetical protein [Candidatus Omnitrophota bacterium]